MACWEELFRRVVIAELSVIVLRKELQRSLDLTTIVLTHFLEFVGVNVLISSLTTLTVLSKTFHLLKLF
ncbi:hypothetical protein Pint_28785 [Pistacia integerrima]|uniref:Uncharacterized protein n=1 Tax=Pistacia integerrima TaxID=434235 RepID=A0ACC0X0I8_9ROSI|nr:hypothetical protein Pint_28785 [Pistacia integerrima]